jgi:hypothetical protein
MDDFGNLIEGVEEESFGVVEPGEYLGYIESVEQKATKSNTGSYLNLKIKLKDGRYVFDMVTVQNQNEQAEKIGKARLKRLSNLCQTTKISGLLKKPMAIKIGVRENAEYGKQNKIVAYNPKEDLVQTSTVKTGTSDMVARVAEEFKGDEISF